MGWFSKITDKAKDVFDKLYTGDKVMDAIKGGIDDITGKTAAEAAERAGATLATAQMDKLDFLKEINALPQEIKEQALTKFKDIFLSDDPAGQQALIAKAKASPLYQEIISTKAAGEESVLRNMSVTGGLRSGNVQDALYKTGANIEKRALTESYDRELGGITALAGIPTYSADIAGAMGEIGSTKADSIIAASDARTQGTQNIVNTGLYGLGAII